MNKFQKSIEDFSKAREWHKFYNPKDLLLGIVEEIGELRNIVKWEQAPKAIKKLISDNYSEFEDNIGDIYWFLCLLANESKVDIDVAISKVIERNKKRFPEQEYKSRHTNPYSRGQK